MPPRGSGIMPPGKILFLIPVILQSALHFCITFLGEEGGGGGLEWKLPPPPAD